MKTRKTTLLVATTVVLALGASACGGSKDDEGGKGGKGGSAAADAALTSIVNKSEKKGGTVSFEMSDEPDSLDPGNTYYGWVQNFSRLYGRTLTSFKPAAGKEGLKVVPDLAESLGKPSADAKTWTYTLKKGLKFQDGTPITSKDVKYAVERSNFAPEALSNGPTYFKAHLVGGDKYQGPYKDKNPAGIASIETPDDTTIVFKLKNAFADFDYLATFSQTAPVPRAADKGAEYVKHIVSSGPYKFSSYEEGKGATLVRNENWDAKTDPIRPALPDKITVRFGVKQETVDANLISDNLTVDGAGTGVAPATQPKVLTDPKLKKQTDNPYAGATSYIGLNVNVAPFNNIECRKAVQWGLDKASVQAAAGGDPKGDVASTLIPPSVAGYSKFNLYETAGNKGDEAKAKAALAKCGHPNGFKTNLSARSDRPSEMAMATAVQASLKKIGIEAEIKSFPAGKYFQNFAGNPSYVKANKLGMIMTAWGADWPTGFGFLDQIINGSAIKPSGGNNVQELNDPAINKMLNEGIATTDTAAREKIWGEVDKAVAEGGTAVPLLYRKNLLLRPASATNVTVSEAYLGMYDYLLMGSAK
ncbi:MULTISPECIES: ABC transporter substrate-binding protein [Streptomyces]|uniref:ABC transporter substrate-binding protein n=1 Tax=Streptomyces TaxID=1883 RepID=UPI001319A808|nr:MULTISPECIES: ABC transporter substrate-binding protein [Streptomyces]QGZ51121.1 ABC transporter substrate-binding protein [Streptomyces sp. QHH-9511]GGU00320.1 peptide ABC transporter substrate-binding protein [Streptomyces lateritius]